MPSQITCNPFPGGSLTSVHQDNVPPPSRLFLLTSQTALSVISIVIFIWAADHILFLITTFLKECKKSFLPAVKITAAPTLANQDLHHSQLKKATLNSKNKVLIQKLSDKDTQNSIQESIYKKLISAKMTDLEDQIHDLKPQFNLSTWRSGTIQRLEKYLS